MDAPYIIAQILALISFLVIIYSSIKKLSRGGLLLFNILANVVSVIHYILLEAYTGAVCGFIFVIMLIVFYFKGKTKFLSSILLPITFGVAFIVFGLLTYQGPISIIPILGHLLLVTAFWMDKEIVIKEFAIAVCVLWVLYSILLHSVVDFIGQFISLVAYIVYVVRYYKKAAKS